MTYTIKSGWIHEEGVGSRFHAKAMTGKGKVWRAITSAEIRVDNSVKDGLVSTIGAEPKEQIETSGIDILKKKMEFEYPEYTWDGQDHRFADVTIPLAI